MRFEGYGQRDRHAQCLRGRRGRWPSGAHRLRQFRSGVGPEEEHEDRPLTDSDRLLPRTYFDVFKQDDEGNAQVFYATDGISSVGLRPWAVYRVGRDSGLTSDPTIAAKSVALGGRCEIRISGSMDMQYVEDVAAIFMACLRSDLQGAYAFNLSGEVCQKHSAKLRKPTCRGAW